MRVLMFQPGLGSYRVDFFNFLAQRCDLKIVYFDAHSSGQRFPESLNDRLQNCKIERLACDNPLASEKRPCLRQCINNFAPDIVVGYEYNPTTMRLGFLRRAGLMHSRFLLWSSENINIVATTSLRHRIIRRIAAATADGLLLRSRKMIDFYRANVAHGKPMAVLPDVQSISRLRRDGENALELVPDLLERHQLKGKKIFLYAGRFEPEKNLMTMLKAWHQAALPNAKLVLLGAGSQLDVMRKFIAECRMEDSIMMPGPAYDRQLFAWYAAGDALILPSTFEPYGAVVNEALAAGVPCLVSEQVGAAELVRSTEAGRVFAPDDTAALAESIRRIAARPAKIEGKLPPPLISRDVTESVDSFLEFARQLIRRTSAS